MISYESPVMRRMFHLEEVGGCQDFYVRINFPIVQWLRKHLWLRIKGVSVVCFLLKDNLLKNLKELYSLWN